MPDFSFEISVADLKDLIRPVNASAAARVTPIFGCTLIELDASGRVTMTSSSGVMSLKKWRQAKHFSGSGRAAIPRQQIEKLAGILEPAATVVFDITDGDLLMSYGPATYPMRGMSASDFPDELLPDAGARRVDLAVEDVARAFSRVGNSVGKDDGTPQICGVNMRSCSDGIRVCGFDGKVLSTSLIPASIPDLDVTLPPEVADEIVRMKSGSATIMISDTAISVETENARFSSLVRGARFIDYAKILEEADDVTACQVERDALLASLRRIEIVAGESGSLVMTISPSALKIRTEMPIGPDVYGADTIACQTDGAERRLGVTVKVLISALSQSKSPEATLIISDKKIFIETSDGKDALTSRRTAQEA